MPELFEHKLIGEHAIAIMFPKRIEWDEQMGWAIKRAYAEMKGVI
jgi:hypothetical protein